MTSFFGNINIIASLYFLGNSLFIMIIYSCGHLYLQNVSSSHSLNWSPSRQYSRSLILQVYKMTKIQQQLKKKKRSSARDSLSLEGSFMSTREKEILQESKERKSNRMSSNRESLIDGIENKKNLQIQANNELIEDQS